MSYASLSAIGNLGSDPELRHTANGNAVASVSVAANLGYGDNKYTEWLSIVAWDKLAEVLSKYTKKGSKIYFEAEPKTETWNDKQTGQDRSAIKWRVTKLVLLDSKEQGAIAPQAPANRPAPRNQSKPVEEVEDENIPF
jgi:single-strand DNA-binding protein